MAMAKWSAVYTRSTNLLSTTANSLANGSESTAVVYDNSGFRNLYAAVTLKLGSITPSTGGSIVLRVTISDGSDVSDRAGGDLYSTILASGASAKIVVWPMVRTYPFSLRFSLINNSGVALAATGNELYVRPYNEDVS
jgi:hypothetical protein